MTDLETKILPPATLGMLGGGQLGRFFVAAAHELGYKVWVLDPDPGSPAGRIADRHLQADYEDQAALAEIVAACAAVTTEFENVPADTLAFLAQSLPVRPSAEAVSVCQHRITEKSFLREHAFPHGDFVPVWGEADLDAVSPDFFPAILKVARFGYDGKGQMVVNTLEMARLALRKFQGEPCVLERKLALTCELSVVLVRSVSGETRCFPVAENEHVNGILDTSIVPARVSSELAAEACAIATRIAAALNYIGTLAVEFFVSQGQLYVNEMAPRPHNSGHYTLDACVCSQYEQQLRALCGLPLGSTEALQASVMVNLLGDLWYEGGNGAGAYREPDWSCLYAVPGLKMHLYGKEKARPGRKMGHFTVVGPDPAEVLEQALAARRAIGIRG